MTNTRLTREQLSTGSAARTGRRRQLSVVLAALLCLGCGRSNGRVEVSGAVTLDGSALESGVISFLSPEKKLPAADAAIHAGQYEISAERGLLPGKYLVAIDAADPGQAAARPDHPAMNIPISKIPLRYNGETELSAEVSAGGINQFDFALTSDPARSVGQTR